FQNPELISIAYYEASLLVDHLVTTFGDAGLQKLVRSFSRVGDTEAALRSELNTDFERQQPGFDEFLERRFGAMARAMAPAKEDVDLMKMPLDDLKKYAADHQGSYVPQLVLGNALRKSGDLDQA